MTGFLTFDGDHAVQAEAQYHSPEMVDQRRHLRRQLALRAGERVLDVGCGPGILALEMAHDVGDAGRVCGIDISESMLALAARRCASAPTVNLWASRAEHLPFGDGEFDATVAVQVLEYVPDVERALAEMHRVLKPGGRAVILDTDWESLVWASDDRSRMRRVLDLWDGHLADPRLPQRLGPLLAEAGFERDTMTTLTFLNRECHESTYSYWLVGFVESFLADQGAVEPDVLAAWTDELHALARAGRYFFSLTRYAARAYRAPG